MVYYVQVSGVIQDVVCRTEQGTEAERNINRGRLERGRCAYAEMVRRRIGGSAVANDQSLLQSNTVEYSRV